jgi:excisionase family DNA binding protein
MEKPDFNNPHGLLTIRETASYLAIPEQTVYFHVHRGTIPAFKIGGRWRVKQSSLDAIVNPQPEVALEA